MNTKPAVKKTEPDQKINVLVFDPAAVSSVIMHLEDMTKKTGTHFAVHVAVSPVEAYARLPHMHIAVIDVEDEGLSIAHDAVEKGILTITTSLLFKPDDFLVETERLKLFKKPRIDVAKFRNVLRSFLEILKKDADSMAFAI